MTLRQLYEKKAAAAEAMKNTMAPDGSFKTSESEAEYDKAFAEFNAFTQQIERRGREVEIEAEQARSATQNALLNGTSIDQERDASTLRKAAFLNWCRVTAGYDPRTDDDRRAERIAIQNAQATTPGAAGGYLVPPEFERDLLIAMKAYFDFDGTATNLVTDTGAPLPWPTVDDTARRAKIIGENTQIGTSNLVFGTTNLTAYLYATDAVLVPWTLMQDSFIDLDTFIRDRLAEAFGRTLAADCTVGTGNGMPLGVVTAAPIGWTTPAGETAGVTYDDLVELEHSVDPAYRLNARFMFNDLTLKALRKIKDTQGRPLWVPSFVAGIPDQFANYTYVINQAMPNLGAGLVPILFGNFKAYITRQVKGVTLVRLNERYADYLQTAFFGYGRFGGGLPTAAQPIKGLQNAAA